MKQPICANCVHVFPYERLRSDGTVEHLFTCRRFPPLYAGNAAINADGSTHPRFAQPQVAASGFCSEWAGA